MSAEIKNQVLNWIESNEDHLVHFLQDIIRIPSVTPWFGGPPELSNEKGVQEYIAKHMEGLGAEIDMWEPNAAALSEYAGMPGYVADRDFTNRPNLAATIKGSGDGKSILLFGHIDVVPAFPGWTRDPFQGEIENGELFGRGAVDMKGGEAAMVIAVEAIMRSGIGLKGDVIVGTVVEEEPSGMGALAFADRGYRADGAIVTESTSMAIAPLCRGILWGKIKLRGRAGHIEMPQEDWRTGGTVDGVKKARYLLDQIDRLNEDWANTKTHPLLRIPCQMRVGKLVAGEFPSSFADEIEIYFDAQFLPRERDEVGGGHIVMKEIEDFLTAVSQADPWLKENPPVVEWIVNADCGETPADHPFVQACQSALEQVGRGRPMAGSYFHTDMGWLERTGTPSLNFGPGNPALAHQNDECVPIQDLVDCAKAIAVAILDWCEIEESLTIVSRKAGP
jgi:acetylornithine deacetylase